MENGGFELFTSTIRQITKSIQKLKSRELSKFGLRGAHAMCLFYLFRHESGLTAAELSELCDMDKGAVSRVLVELEAGDFVACSEPVKKRRYRAKISLTEKGWQITEKINGAIEEIVDKVGRGLSEAEKTTMYKALSRISENLRSEG
jgi:DNA-binding MarR family transcriptional regulator